MGSRNISKTKRSQVSLEYLMLVGIILIIMIPIFYYSVREATEQIRLNQAEDAVNSLAKTADAVYALGPGSRDYVTITIPTGISGSYVDNSEIVLKMDIAGTTADIVGFSKAIVMGALPTEQGTHHIIVEMLDSGIVQIGSANDTLAPQIVYTYPGGMIVKTYITMKANTNEPALCRYDTADKSYSTMGNNFGGTLMSHERYLGLLDEGNYIFYARCMDPYNNTMQSSAVINFTIVPAIITNITNQTINQTVQTNQTNQTNETFEQDPPAITLVSPADGYADNDGIVLFQYSVTDASTVSFCELIMNNAVIQLATGISKTSINNITKSSIDYGSYNWSINCTDVHGNTGKSEQRRIAINYTQDHDLPIVKLMAPADGTIRNYWLIKFSYNTSDATSSIAYCTLHMNGTLDDGGTIAWSVIDSSVIENNAESITLPLFRADYTWQMSCTDSSYNANTGYSETRNIRVNITAGEEAFINSCAGWCGLQGLSNGVCENNVAKCGNNCGLAYSPTNNCYAGSSVSSQYCTGGPESSKCCCIL